MSDPETSSEVGEPGPETGDAAQPFLIVGIGASAGGLGAFTAFLKEMPVNNGMAFVLVQHLSPDHKSALVDLLGRATAMPVVEAAEGTSVEANTVYVIPPNATLTIEDRVLGVSRPAPPRERRRPIDTFFSSLAEDQGENAVCIILSGTGSDGTLGLKTVKESGGFALAQAEFDHTAMSGMPRSAAATGLVDDVLPVEAMPARILAYRKHLEAISGRKDPDGTRRDMADHLRIIKRLLRAKTGHDFSGYKDSTVTRRIQRRMQILQIAEAPDYIARLANEPVQIELLFRDLLIGVTRFFRDPDAFAALETFLPRLCEGKGSNDQIRIWVPGCATGEEVYSIALLIREQMDRRGIAPKVQIFGTDIDDAAVAFARSGRYRKLAGVSAERLDRWFAEDGEDLCPVKEVREMCIFSTHSVVKDPPFSKLDLISCRNVLIYMDSEFQDRVIRTFHYALKPDGLMFLGPSEGVTRFAGSFTALDKKHRVFQRRNDGGAERTDFISLPAPGRTDPLVPAPAPPPSSIDDRIDRAARRALAKYSPAWIIVNEGEEILRFSGSEAGHYLEPISGAASLNLFALLKKPLKSVVRNAMRTVNRYGDPVVAEDAVLRVDGRSRTVSAIVAQITERRSGPKLYVVGFRDSGPAGADGLETPASHGAAGEALEHELRTTRIQLQSAIDELETVNEEMKSATEEYQSVNEELQSSNEELETAKEEMQSVNEELLTINAEMQVKNDMLARANNDLKNLLDSTEIATIFLDNDLRIKSFTPGMIEIFHLRDSDRGRPVTDIVSQVKYDELRADVHKVLRNLVVVEKELQLSDKG